MSDGYGYWWKGRYWASLSTGGDPDIGRHDIYFGPVGADTHGHLWVKIPSDSAAALGAQLKDRGQHVSPAVEGSFSTHPVLRGRVEWSSEANAVRTEIAQIQAPICYSAAPVTSARTASSRSPTRVDLNLPDAARWFEFDLAVTLQQPPPAGSTSEYLLAFNSNSPVAVNLTVTRWGSS